MENKFAKVPVASHGLHKHDYNFPWLSSINFGDVMPCYYNTIRKGERDSPNAGFYSQLMPVAHNAFATGRFNFKGIFVPYKLVWRPWYSFDQQIDFHSDGVTFRPNRYPFVTQDTLLEAFVKNYCNVTTQGNHDFIVVVSSSPSDEIYYVIKNDDGRRVFRILCALGCCFSFIADDISPMNILALMCYIKAYSDYYFPNNYVGNMQYDFLSKFFDSDTIDFSADAYSLLMALNVCSLNFYENSIFDLAWDNPVAPNNSYLSPTPINITDETVDSTGAYYSHVSDDADVNTHTPVVDTERMSGFSQYILNALKSLTLWTKRRQLAGRRLLDKFLVSRGLSLSEDSARISYFIGQRNIEIEVSGVENNTDVNLGELAGRGIASSGNNPISFECRPDDDGIFFVIVSPIPDANFPVYFDGFTNRQDVLDNYNAEFDKLGSAAVPSSVVARSMNGAWNYQMNPNGDGVFGFLSQYWDEIQERPRLLGDFMLLTRGAVQLQAYHTFRMFPLNSSVYQHHSYDFVRMSDNSQYQRLFYSGNQENLMMFLRWYGSQYKEKLPLGDSYEWDDDELNRKVNVVIGGSQK